MLKVSILFNVTEHINMTHRVNRKLLASIWQCFLQIFHIKHSSKSINNRAILQPCYEDRPSLIAGVIHPNTYTPYTHIISGSYLKCLTFAPGIPVRCSCRTETETYQLVKRLKKQSIWLKQHFPKSRVCVFVWGSCNFLK